MSSGSEKSRSPERSRSKARLEHHKLFVTNLDGTAKREEIEAELTEFFGKYGPLKEVSARRSRNGDYSFAFVEYQDGDNAEEAIKNLNGTMVRGKPMKVEIQDDAKRRKDPDKGCYTCGKKGHFARECRSNQEGRRRSVSRSRSESEDRNRRRRRHSDSESSERDRDRKRSRNKKDKDRKHSSKDKKKKKHKKRRSSSDSDS